MVGTVRNNMANHNKPGTRLMTKNTVKRLSKMCRIKKEDIKYEAIKGS